MKRLLVAITCLMCPACATAPLVVPIERSITTSKSKNEVWANLIEFFAINNISIKTIEKESGIVYAERTSSRPGELNEWTDCGAGPLMVPVRQALDLNVFVREATDSSAPKTTITVNARFQETRQTGFANGIETVDCNSLGVLEGMIQKHAVR